VSNGSRACDSLVELRIVDEHADNIALFANIEAAPVCKTHSVEWTYFFNQLAAKNMAATSD
jgi:hypothetical protein